MPRVLCAVRSSFTTFLQASLSVRWQGSALHTVVFPLPAPFPSAFTGGGPGLSKKRLRILATQRMVHVICMALNKMYFGRVPRLEEIRRPPGAAQLCCIRRLFNFVAACGSRQERFPCAPGRSGPELIASLMRLEAFVSLQPVFQDSYAAPYPRTTAPELPVEVLDQFPQLRPYRSLDAERLRLRGGGRWPLEEYLEGVLWLPYVEPAFLLHQRSTVGLPIPSFAAESRDEYLKLARRWEELGLLRLVEKPIFENAFVRVFNAFKDSSCDRQIGDRRIVNYAECHGPGPSSRLPQGQMLTALHVEKGGCMKGSITDRRDFYHQCSVTPERFATNLVPFSFPPEVFEGSAALEDFKQRSFQRNGGREIEGDKLGEKIPRKKKEMPEALYPSFGALYQGDHLGVEFALGGHEGLLASEGLLRPEDRLLGGRLPPRSKVWEALIIDDFFVISMQKRTEEAKDSEAFKRLERAREAYKRHGLEGSPEKDAVAEDLFKAAGAEIDSRSDVLSRSLALVGAPLGKRVGLASLSLRIAALGFITPTLASRMAGGWTSALLYRRCIASIVNRLFQLGTYSDESRAHEIIRLSNDEKEELVLLSMLAPLVCSNVMVGYSKQLFATDASLAKGAIVRTSIDSELSETLWQGASKKGHYTRLDGPFRELLHHIGEEPAEVFEVEEELPEEFGKPQRAIPMTFDFVEICGGVGAVTKAMADMNLVCAPVLDLSNSKKYNIISMRMLEWIYFMLAEGNFRSYVLAPPCTSFSPAAHPAVRSYRQPKGFCRTHPKVLHGNGLAFKSFLIKRQGIRFRRPSLLEQPRLSKMAWLSAWAWLRSHGCEEAVAAACQFGSVHRKEFRLLCYLLPVEDLERRCRGGHTHIPVAGSYTKGTAIYPEKLAIHMAKAFKKALLRSHLEEKNYERVSGYESVVMNDLLVARRWEVERSWRWKRRAHINVYEASTVTSLLNQLIQDEPSTRHNLVVDSRVAQGSLVKGRSSALSLQPVLQKAAACQLAGDIYPAITFGPTRIIPADAPSRDREIEEPVPHSILSNIATATIPELHDCRLPRPYANWVRLSLLVCFSNIPASAASPSYPSASPSGFALSWTVLLCLLIGCGVLGSVKGYFRFGPFARIVWILLLSSRHVGAPMVPMSAAEESRAQFRSGLALASDRLIRPQTRVNRQQLLSAFQDWIFAEHGLQWQQIISAVPLDLELLNRLLVGYGKEMHASGKAYGKYAETINAVATAKPLVKRHLTMAWDLAFAWLQDEPADHHPAMPVSVLLAAMSVGLMWGWPVVSALLGLTWAGLLRIGEVLAATRADLVLPYEAPPGTKHILLRIQNPKTRGRVARHQAARVDPADIVALVQAVFKDYGPDQPLWSMSGCNVRKRFVAILNFLGLPVKKTPAGRPYDLASLRPGGATFLLGLTEDAELVRRRGRWISQRVLEIYLQEIAVSTAVAKLPDATRQKIGRFASVFGEVLIKVIEYLAAHVPEQSWHILFQHHQRPGSKGKDGF